MTKMSNLPRDLAEEVLCRTPLKSLRSVRSTCKKWNTLSKDLSFAKKHLGQAKAAAARERESTVVVMMDYRLYLMSINLHNKDVESCIKPRGKLISLDGEVDDIALVFHYDGLLLCIAKCRTRFTVWNPYWGKIRRIEIARNFRYGCSHALGYDKRRKSYKILRFIDIANPVIVDFRIYDFISGSWRVLDVTPQDWIILCNNHGVSLKGNTYWFASDKDSGTNDSFLVCFDFTSETFGPRLPMPSGFEFYHSEDALSLSIVREEQLAVLYQPWDSLNMEIWVTNKIEPNAVSWNSKVFLAANIKQLIGPVFQFTNASFFIDEEKKVAVVFDKDKKDIDCSTPNNMAYIFGVDGSLKQVDLGECANRRCYPRLCSYVPSLVQLN